MIECHSCGAELDPRDKFCSTCGAINERGRGAGELARRFVAELADSSGKLFAAALGYLTDPENSKRVAVAGGVALLLLISFTSNPISRGVEGFFAVSVEDLEDMSGDPSLYLSPDGSYEIVGLAVVYSQPREDGHLAIEVLSQGDLVEAMPLQDRPDTSGWFQLSGGGFIHGTHLVATSAPTNEVVSSFPDYLQGQWGGGPKCGKMWGTNRVRIKGGQYVEVDRTSSLVRASFNAAGVPVFWVQMVEHNGNEYPGALAIQMNSARNGISVDDLNTSAENRRWKYRSGVPCAEQTASEIDS